MKEYIEKILHLKIEKYEAFEPVDFPLYLKKGFKYQKVSISGVHCLLIKSKEKMNLVTIKKQYIQIEKRIELPCVFVFDTLREYPRAKMIEAGIPFIINEQQIYLPFLGIALANQKERYLDEKELTRFSFMTQKMICQAIYERWNKKNVTEIAECMRISKMSVTRCLDEIEAVGINAVHKEGRSRYFLWQESYKKLFQISLLFMQSPVYKEINLTIKTKKSEHSNYQVGGISALSQYSMIADNDYMTYAISRDEAKNLKFNEMPIGEVPEEVIQVMQYMLPYGKDGVIDPLSTALILQNEARKDSRIEKEIEEMLEEYVW